MRVIFLDIDGVLNKLGTFDEGCRTGIGPDGFIGMDSELVERFNRLVVDVDADIVLSSSWRGDPNWHETMVRYGIVDRFIDRTPRLKGIRGHEIYSWLKKNREVREYAIIDDESDMLVLQKPHFFKTSYKEGLTEEICDQIRAHFLHTKPIA